MMRAFDLFQEFPSVGKQAWLQQITKDLKGRALEELEWEFAAGMRMSPFVHLEDFSALPQPLWQAPKNWEISERIVADDPAVANAQALEALNGGADSLEFYWESAPTPAAFQQVFEGIHPDFIGLHFSGPGVEKNPAGIFGLLLQLTLQRGVDGRALHGTVAYTPRSASGLVDWRYFIELIDFVSDNFPGFKVLGIPLSGASDPVAALTDCLKEINYYLTQLSERGVAPAATAALFHLYIPVGKQYFVEIAKIRALHLLWNNLMNGWKTAAGYPFIAAHFQSEAYTEELYTNMIRAATMSMSAVLGGADRLTVLPYDTGREGKADYPQAFGRRIARNVQHLMKMESRLHEKMDPAAGSYYIETLTQKLAKEAWAAFAGA